jgi:hypothetical protein
MQNVDGSYIEPRKKKLVFGINMTAQSLLMKIGLKKKRTRALLLYGFSKRQLLG